jgi:hypothetical protein
MEDLKRQLNMEEKKNLQRLLFSDITTASVKYKAARDKERELLKRRLIERAPRQVRAHFTKWANASAVKAHAEKQVEALGYVIRTYQSPPSLDINDYGKLPKELSAFDEETKRTEKKITDLKRDFTLRLFAGGEEARGLFAALSSELTKIQKD